MRVAAFGRWVLQVARWCCYCCWLLHVACSMQHVAAARTVGCRIIKAKPAARQTNASGGMGNGDWDGDPAGEWARQRPIL